MLEQVKHIAIIGGGQMGQGIAYCCAISGYDVMIYDISANMLNNAVAKLSSLKDKNLSNSKINDSQAAMIDKIIMTDNIANIAHNNLIIEAATENESIKMQIFERLNQIISDNVIVATNTSSLSITKLSTCFKNPANFIGVHFMNPVPVMGLVELIGGLATSDNILLLMQDFVESLSKKFITSSDMPAFVVNRVLIPMINEAITALSDGVASAKDIDNAMRLGANFPMGPIELADFIGLDTCLAIMQRLHSGFGDDKYRPALLLKQYVDMGWLGRKTKKGFYNY